uniref:Uncharacterized protein n=1 Tax=viral metagenome TaxID=1070528 RepID=A0A6H1ZHE9_9ZZZZ
MTKDEARMFLSSLVAKRELGRLYADLFAEAIYAAGFEVVDRKIDDDTARHLDNELSDVESDDWIREVLIGLGAEEGK